MSDCTQTRRTGRDDGGGAPDQAAADRAGLIEPCVVWFTGLSGAGKSTLAAALHDALCDRGVRTECLDGDVIRALSPGSGFTRADRDAHVRRVGYLASRFEHHGITAVCALISPYRDARAEVRRRCQRFVEVYVSTSLAECERRDPKGLYARARRREIAHFTGIDDPYEPPLTPELTLDTSALPVADAVARVLAVLPRPDRRAPPPELL